MSVTFKKNAEAKDPFFSIDEPVVVGIEIFKNSGIV
jgi:hypothetical protein